MATVTAPLVNIAVAAAIPDVVRSCIIPQPPPDDGDDPVGDTGIYTPVPPGITFPDLPPAPTIVDTSPDQMIGCIVTVGDNPQGRLNALFPAAIDGDGVIDRTTNDIWTYDGATWNNVGPTPGPTLVTDTVIPPWSEILLYDAPLIVGLNVRSFSYALEVLTTPDPLSLVVGLNVVRTMPIAGPYSIAVEVPTITGGASVAVPAGAIQLAAGQLTISTGVNMPLGAAAPVIVAPKPPVYVGPFATVLQPDTTALDISAPLPAVSSGGSATSPAAAITCAAHVPAVNPSVPFVQETGTGASSSAFGFTPVSVEPNDIVVLLIETSGADSVQTPTVAFSSITGDPFQQITGSPVTDVASTAGSTLQAWWMRATNSTTSGFIDIPDNGDHQVARYLVIRGCATTGNPWDATATATKPVASDVATAPAVTTAVYNTFVVSVITRPNDSSSTISFGTPTNANLTNIIDIGEVGTTAGNGGGFVAFSGTKVVPGSTGISSITGSAPNVTNASMTIAFRSY